MNTNRVIRVALEAGKLILENGGETYRAEETMSRICSAYDIPNSENYVSPTVIITSVITNKGKPISLTKRIKYRTVNLDKIDKINNLSRNIKINNLTLDEVEEYLEYINNENKTYSFNLNILFSCLISSFFTLLFGGNGNDFVISFIVGALLQLNLVFLKYVSANVFFTNLVGGFTVALGSIIGHLIIPNTNIDKIIIGSIMILVPGIAIVNAIRDTISGDLISGIIRAVEAFLIAIAIAVGTGTVLKVFYMVSGGINL
ncbi:threonine/serine exporter family protein [Clostridium oceanicum]|uniref:Threonine/serine exporter family protein n=1 Tax=Clostridium oceanicum TaxID=1543 RepID=A0ABP3V3J4_9CLOT